jgi:hypothetical protein
VSLFAFDRRIFPLSFFRFLLDGDRIALESIKRELVVLRPTVSGDYSDDNRYDDAFSFKIPDNLKQGSYSDKVTHSATDTHNESFQAEVY